MQKKTYPYESADMLHNFVRSMNYREKLSNTAQHIYFSAMPELEKMKSGFCQPTTATYKELSEYACISIPGIRGALDNLNGTLCKVEFGQPLRAEKQATRFTRYTLSELQAGTAYQALKQERPGNALELQRLLENRIFIYGDAEIKPSWSVSNSGRLYSSQPNIQGRPKKERGQNICRGLRQGEVLFDIDYRQAEPTIIQHAAGYTFDSDPYNTLKDILGIARDDAKAKLNMLHYIETSPVRMLNKWPVDAVAAFMPYAEALQAFREKLWTVGTPQGKDKRRYVKTLGGSIIEAERGKPPHRGQILNWFAQGTMADILNQVCLEIIKHEKVKGWRFICPMHDAAYVIGKPEHEADLKAIFLKWPETYGLKIKIESEVIR